MSSLKKFRLVSNLSFVSKLIERAAFNQIQDHLVSNNLYPVAQSAYRRNHSTDTALLKVTNDRYSVEYHENKQQVTILVLLDFSAAFDSVDLSILRDTYHAFFSSRLGYCNSLLYGLPEYQIQKLQRVQNSAAYYTITKSPTLATRSKSNSF